jgi:hypothetical protein
LRRNRDLRSSRTIPSEQLGFFSIPIPANDFLPAPPKIQVSVSLTAEEPILHLRSMGKDRAAKSTTRPGGKTVFVLDLADGQAFAFGAESAATADVTVRAPEFILALNRFCEARGIVRNERRLLPREATAREEAAYTDYFGEFPEALGRLLVVRLDVR